MGIFACSINVDPSSIAIGSHLKLLLWLLCPTGFVNAIACCWPSEVSDLGPISQMATLKAGALNV